MLVGYALIRPVSDRWAGSIDAQALDGEGVARQGTFGGG
jgi:hypothetical protein